MNNFLVELQKWIESLSQEEYNKFIRGIDVQSLLVLFKHFPDNEMIKELIREKV